MSVNKIVIQSSSGQEITATEIQINNKQITQPVTFVVNGVYPTLEMTDAQLQVLVNGNKTFTNWVTTTFHSPIGSSGFISMTLSTPQPLSEINEVYVYSVYQAVGYEFRMQYNIILYDVNNTEIGRRTTQEIYDAGNAATAYAIAKFNEQNTTMNLDAIQEKSSSVRYIRDYLNGSNENGGNHWVEINAYENGANRASNKPVTSPYGVIRPLSVITDGDTNTDNYAEVANGSLVYVEIDLEDIFNIDEITVWHYYGDGRTYNDTRTQVSADGITWIDVFNSAVSGTYPEPTGGSGKSTEISIFNSTFIGSPIVGKTSSTLVGNINALDNSPMVEYVQINSSTGEMTKSPQLFNSNWNSIRVSNTANSDPYNTNGVATGPGFIDVDTGYPVNIWNCFINGWYVQNLFAAPAEFRVYESTNWIVRFSISISTITNTWGYLIFIRKN